MKRLLACLVLAACSSVTDEDVGRASDPLIEDQLRHYWAHFDKNEDIRKEWSKIDRGKRWGGDFLGWHESFVLESLIDMWHATKDPKLTDELVDRADVIFSLRDDVRGQKDDARGHVMKAWGSYLDLADGPRGNDWICEIVENGMLTKPIADFVRTSEASGDLSKRYGNKIDRYRALLLETVDSFDDEWHESGDEGFYDEPKKYPVYPAAAGRPAVYNKAFALGTTMAILADTNLPDHAKKKMRERTRKMAKFFTRRAHRSDSGRIVWDYGSWIPMTDDVGHGGIVAGFFAVLGEDVDAFIHTFRFVSDGNEMAGYVNGDRAGAPGAHAHAIDQHDADQACGRWLDLAAHEPSLADRCKGMDDDKQTAFAKWLRYRK